MPSHRSADIEAAVDISEARRGFGGFGRAVRKLDLKVRERAHLRRRACHRLLAELIREEVAAGLEIVAFGPIAVDVADEISAQRHVDGQVRSPLICGAAVGG